MEGRVDWHGKLALITFYRKNIITDVLVDNKYSQQASRLFTTSNNSL